MKAREIKFRGKSIDKGVVPYYSLGEWIYGSFYRHEWDGIWTTYLLNQYNDEIQKIIVDPKTVGQFTGLLDRNGKDIYEGDVLQTKLLSGETILQTVKWEEYRYTGILYYHSSEIIGNEFEEVENER